MGNFSRDTFNSMKHYVSVRLQQGVPIVDADWNEMDDIRRYELRAFLKWFVGDGVPQGNDGFHIVAVPAPDAGPTPGPVWPPIIVVGLPRDDFIIRPGRCLVDGWDVINERQIITYKLQPLYGNDTLADLWGVDPLPNLDTLAGDLIVYLDTWEREVDSDEDPELKNEIIDIETCVRLKREWVVRVVAATDRITPPLEQLRDKGLLKDNHAYYPLAYLNRSAEEILEEDITDLRCTGLSVKNDTDMKVFLETSGSRLSNGDAILWQDLLDGLRIELSATVDPATVVQETCFVTAEFPISGWSGQLVGYSPPFMLLANTTANRSLVTWQPNPDVEFYLRDQRWRRELPAADPNLLTRLMLKGNLISTASYPPSRLSSGDLEMWFRLTLPPVSFECAVEVMLAARDAVKEDRFGVSVAISEDQNTIVVGAPGKPGSDQQDVGAAYVFVRDIAGSWSAPWRLPEQHYELKDNFGYSVAISEETVVIGATGGGTAAGAAYVFVRDSAAPWSTWSAPESLPSSGIAANDIFGCSVAISEDQNTIVVGASGLGGGTDAGAAYVYARNSADSWDALEPLTAPDAEGRDQFGCSVAISENTIVIGARGKDSNAGAAYVSIYDTTNGWSVPERLPSGGVAAGDCFGRSVAISGDTIVVGAMGVVRAGTAYVFVRNSAGSWHRQAKRTASNAATEDHFGSSVAVSGDTVVVGAPGIALADSKPNAGAAYVFEAR